MILSTIAGTPQLNLTSRHVGITGLCRTKAQTSASLLEILSDTKGELLTKSHQRDWIHEIKWQVSITMVVWVFWASFFFATGYKSLQEGRSTRQMIKHFSVAPSKPVFVHSDPQILLCEKVGSWANTSELLQAGSY